MSSATPNKTGLSVAAATAPGAAAAAEGGGEGEEREDKDVSFARQLQFIYLDQKRIELKLLHRVRKVVRCTFLHI
jgi:hypothetical protein